MSALNVVRNLFLVLGFQLLVHQETQGQAVSAPTLKVELSLAEDIALLQAGGPPGEYRLEVSEDLGEWTPFRSFGLSVPSRELNDVETGRSRRFYRLTVWSYADGFHLHGPFAERFMAALNQPEQVSASSLGLTFQPNTEVPPEATHLASSDRSARTLAAAVGAMSSLAQHLRDTVAPGAQEADLIDALLRDLSSGQLDGRDADGQPILIGGEVPLPTLGLNDLKDALADLKAGLPGLDNVHFVIQEDGSLLLVIPADWNSIHWDSADWR